MPDRHGDGDERGVGLTGRRVGLHGGARRDVVGDDDPARVQLRPREPEQQLVVVLPGVEEDDVEAVLELGQDLLRVTLDELRPFLEAGVGDVPAPRLDLAGLLLQP